MGAFHSIEGGVTAAGGFAAGGVHCGVKRSSLDLALLVSDPVATAAAVFTTNRVQGAPVRLCRQRLAADAHARAVVVNSGNANACTGEPGLADARRMGAVAASALGLPEDQVLVCSTGVVGVPLPMDCIERGIGAAVEALSDDGGSTAAQAIMTTDTVAKEAAVELEIDGAIVRVGGMAKGAGMIEPNMATMLAFLTTDATVEAEPLQAALAEAVGVSFNCISVDGDQSCNDTVLLLANGAAGGPELTPASASWPAFAGAVREVCMRLAFKIVEDGEGATKFVTVNVHGAATPRDARMACRAVANSLLVKTSWYGCDPNWGRVIDAVGHSGCELDEGRVDIRYDDVLAVSGGCAAPDFPLRDLEAVLARDRFAVTIDLNMGQCSDVVYTCDCSEEYVRINSAYTT